MAIEYMNAYNCVGADGLDQIKDFVEEHNPDLFDTITVNGGQCTAKFYPTSSSVSTLKYALEIKMPEVPETAEASSRLTIACAGLSSLSTFSDYSSQNHFSKIYSTSKGIMITIDHDAGDSFRSAIIVSKEDDIGLYMTLISRTATSSENPASKEGHMQYAQSIAAETIVYDNTTYTDDLSLVTALKPKTMLIPIVFYSGAVTHNVFRLVYNENPEHETIFTLGGVQYVTDGVFALKE